MQAAYRSHHYVSSMLHGYCGKELLDEHTQNGMDKIPYASDRKIAIIETMQNHDSKRRVILEKCEIQCAGHLILMLQLSFHSSAQEG